MDSCWRPETGSPRGMPPTETGDPNPVENSWGNCSEGSMEGKGSRLGQKEKMNGKGGQG